MQQPYGQGSQAQGGYYGGAPQQHQAMYSSPYSPGSQPTLPRYASNSSSVGGGPQQQYYAGNQHQYQQQQQHHPPSAAAYQYHPHHYAGAAPGGAAAAGNPTISPSPLNPANRATSSNSIASSNSSLGPPGAAGAGRYSTYGYANGGPGAAGGPHPLSHALYADSPSSPTLAGGDDDHNMDEKKGLASFPPPSSSSSSGSSSNNNNGNRQFSRLARNGGGGPAARDSTANNAYKRWSGVLAADASKEGRHSKLERIGWIDGLRFFVACVAMNGTFFAATITNDQSYSAIQRNSPLYIFRSFNLSVCFFLIIIGRALAAPLWDIPNGRTSPDGAKYGASTPAPSPTIAFSRLTRGMLTRTFRFILPVLVITALLWGLGAGNATKDCADAGIQPPYWNLISRFSGYVTVVFDCFSAFSYLTSMAKTFSGNLWTNAWFFQSSFAVYLVHLMLGNLSSSRYWVYFLLAFFMWTTENYFCVAIIGLVIADIAAHGQFAKIRRWPLMRILAVQIVLVAIAVCFQFINPVRNRVNHWFSVINVGDNDDITFCDMLFATCFMLVFETSAILQAVLGNVVMRMLGKLAPGIYLLAPAITYTVVPTIGISLKNSGTGASGILGVTWVVCFAICVVGAIAFHFLVELPSKLAGEYFADFVEAWGRRPEDHPANKIQTKAPQKAAPKKIAGPGAK